MITFMIIMMGVGTLRTISVLEHKENVNVYSICMVLAVIAGYVILLSHFVTVNTPF